ncbi:RsbW Anti-sigma regulatory factor (Ser/Thr protein kinase) [Rhabdaerophilaceae bacterium]
MLLRRMEFELGPDLSDIQLLADAMERFSKFAAIPSKVLFRLNLAIDELVTNTISYGFQQGEQCYLGVTVLRHDDVVEVELRDNGIPFDPLSLPSPDLDASLEDRPIGGLGVHFVRTLIEQVDYTHDGRHNIVRLSVPLHPRSETEPGSPRHSSGTPQG